MCTQTWIQGKYISLSKSTWHFLAGAVHALFKHCQISRRGSDVCSDGAKAVPRWRRGAGPERLFHSALLLHGKTGHHGARASRSALHLDVCMKGQYSNGQSVKGIHNTKACKFMLKVVHFLKDRERSEHFKWVKTLLRLLSWFMCLLDNHSSCPRQRPSGATALAENALFGERQMSST